MRSQFPKVPAAMGAPTASGLASHIDRLGGEPPTLELKKKQTRKHHKLSATRHDDRLFI